MSQLPEKPWNEGDKFTNDATGVEYTFDGVKWLASGGEELDLSGYVSKTGGDAMEGPLHVKGHSGDSRGTSRIKTLGIFSDSNSALRLGTTTDRIYVEDENTKFNGGVLVNNIGPKTEDGRGVTLNVEGTGGKHLVTKSYVDDGDKALQDQIDDCVKQSASWDMSLGTTLGVNQLKPLDDGTPFVYYEPRDWNNTHPCGILNRGLMENYVDDAIDGYVSKSGDEITGQLTIKKSTEVALDIVGDGNQSQIKFWSSGAIALQRYTAFKDNELVTKNYVDKKVDEISVGVPELPKFKLVAGDYTDWENGSIAVFDIHGENTTSIDSTRTIIVSAFDVDGKRWGRDEDCIEYAKHFNGHVNVTSEDGKKTLFNMSPHYNSKCELFYWPGNEEYPHPGYVIYWQGLQSHTVTSRESAWNVGSFYRLSIPEIFF